MGRRFRSFDGCKIPLDRRLAVRSRIVHLLASHAAETSEMDNPNQIDPNEDCPTISHEDSMDTPPEADDDFPPPDDSSCSSHEEESPSDYYDDCDDDDDSLDFLGFAHALDDATPTATHIDDPIPYPIFTGESPQPEFTISEMAMLDLLILCDSSGARRGLYDDLLSVLRRHSKKGFSIRQARTRDVFLRDLKKKVPLPAEPLTTTVGGRSVVHFSFSDMLRDLLSSSMFESINNLCANQNQEDRFSKFVPSDPADQTELMAKGWACETYMSLEDFDPETDFFLPIMLYGDKTGTDVNQRYPLEPWMFTSPILRRNFREMSNAWRHLGFIPSLDRHSAKDASGSGSSGTKLKSPETLQLYHDFMSVLLQGIKDFHREKPWFTINLGGVKERRRQNSGTRSTRLLWNTFNLCRKG